jgi:hypothetical protein
MQNDTLIIIRLIFAGLFGLTLLAGAYLAQNFDKFFVSIQTCRARTTAPALTANAGSVIWAHAFLLTGAFRDLPALSHSPGLVR